jgi:hypothetical protein
MRDKQREYNKIVKRNNRIVKLLHNKATQTPNMNDRDKLRIFGTPIVKPTDFEYPINDYKNLLTKEVEIKNVKILFLISNYEREAMLKELLGEIKVLNSENIIADYIIFDDQSSYVINDSKTIINNEHRGKFNYWMTFNDMFKYAQKNIYDIYVFTPNDFLKYNFKKIVEYGIKLFNIKYVFNTLNDGRTTCWNFIKPINLTEEVDLIFFSDCGFFTNYKTLSALEFKMNEIYTRNNNIGSRVGAQITARINNLRIPIFHPKNSLVYHGNHPTLMHKK